MQRLAGPDPRLVPILRLAFLGGTGLLGAVIGFVRSQGAATAPFAATRPLTLAGQGLWGVAIAACLFLGALIRNQRDPQKIFALCLVGWAFAESTAIYGAVLWFLLGTSQWYFAGLGFLALTLVALPGVRRS